MPFATVCDELKVFSSDEPFNCCASHKITDDLDLYGNISWSGDAAWLTVTPTKNSLPIFKWDNDKLVPHRHINCKDVKSAIFLNWTNKELILGLENGEIRMWNIREKSVSCFVDTGPKQPVNFLTCNMEDSCIASGCLSSNRVGLHSLKTNKYLRSLELPSGELTSCLRFCRCKKEYLGASTSASTVCVWDVVRCQSIFSQKNADLGSCSGVEFSPLNFSVLACVSLSQKLKLFDLRKRNKIIEIHMNEPLHCVDVFPEGDKIAVGSSKGNVIMYDLRAGKVSATIEAHNNVIHALSINKLQRVKEDNDETISESPGLANHTLDISVMDVFSPIARTNVTRGSMTCSSAGNTPEFRFPVARAQNNSFLSAMLSPSIPQMQSSPIVDLTMPAPQPVPNRPPTLQHNITNNSPIVQPSSMGNSGDNNQMSSPEQDEDLDITPERTPQNDIFIGDILTELNKMKDGQDISHKLLSDQISSLGDTLMDNIGEKHDAVTDQLINVKRDFEKIYYDMRYDLVTQRILFTECFNKLTERIDKMVVLMEDLTENVSALRNRIDNGRY